MSLPLPRLLDAAHRAYLERRDVSQRLRDELQAVYDSAGSTRAVAALWGCSKPTAWLRLKWAGVDMMPAGGGTPGRTMPDGGPDGRRYRGKR